MMTVAILSSSILAFLFCSSIRTDCGNRFEFSATLLGELHFLQALYTNPIHLDSADGLLQSGLLRDRFLDPLHFFQLKKDKIFWQLDLFPSSDERARRSVGICLDQPDINSLDSEKVLQTQKSTIM